MKASTLCTLTGKWGDMLWQLAVAKRIAEALEEKVDIGVMQGYERIFDLVMEQDYVHTVEVVRGWVATGSPFGDQPWQAPIQKSDTRAVRHLGYRCHPAARRRTLIQALLMEQGFSAGDEPASWITVKNPMVMDGPFLAWGGNDTLLAAKLGFREQLESAVKVVDLRPLDWLTAARFLASDKCRAYVGDLSSLQVLAFALGKEVVVFEPELGRAYDPVFRFGWLTPTGELRLWGKQTLLRGESTVQVLDSLGLGVLS